MSCSASQLSWVCGSLRYSAARELEQRLVFGTARVKAGRELFLVRPLLRCLHPTNRCVTAVRLRYCSYYHRCSCARFNRHGDLFPEPSCGIARRSPDAVVSAYQNAGRSHDNAWFWSHSCGAWHCVEVYASIIVYSWSISLCPCGTGRTNDVGIRTDQRLVKIDRRVLSLDWFGFEARTRWPRPGDTYRAGRGMEHIAQRHAIRPPPLDLTEAHAEPGKTGHQP